MSELSHRCTTASISAEVATTEGFTSGFVLCAIVAGAAAVIALVLVRADKPSGAFVGHGHGHRSWPRTLLTHA